MEAAVDHGARLPQELSRPAHKTTWARANPKLLLPSSVEAICAEGLDHTPRAEDSHAPWFSDDVYASLRAAGAALCIAEAEKLETPLQVTTSWGYLRLLHARGPRHLGQSHR